MPEEPLDISTSMKRMDNLSQLFASCCIMEQMIFDYFIQEMDPL